MLKRKEAKHSYSQMKAHLGSLDFSFPELCSEYDLSKKKMRARLHYKQKY